MKTYILIREDNIINFSSRILNQISKYYKAQICLMTRDRSREHISIELNKNLIVFPHSQLTSAKARKLAGDSSAIYIANDNYLEHVPTVDRSVRAMIGLGPGAHALIVEVIDSRKFNVRNLTVVKNVCYDLGTRFDGNTIKHKQCESSYYPDLHEYTHDREMLAKMLKHSKKIGTKEIIIGDTFDALSVNHHEIHSSLYEYNKIANNVTLEDEIHSLAKTLNKIAENFSLKIVESNHDDFLQKIIKDEESLDKCSPLDKIILLELKIKLIRDILAKKSNEPILKKLLDLHCNLSKKITFWNKDDVVARAGFIVSLHGDKGPNGAKFNYKSTTLPKSITGHNHVGGYKNNNFSVGHVTDLKKQNYARGGLSSWTYSLVDIYENGTAQLITFF